MEIAIIADDTRKELMIQFCIAYCGTLSKHTLCATAKTATILSEATGLTVEPFLSGSHGGMQQITSHIACDEIDVLLYFRATNPQPDDDEAEYNLLRMCDVHNVPFATNIGTAEVIVHALEHGDLDWRELVNPHSEYNRRKRGSTSVGV